MTTHGTTGATDISTASELLEAVNIKKESDALLRAHLNKLRNMMDNLTEDEAVVVTEVLVKNHPEIVSSLYLERHKSMSDCILNLNNLMKGVI